MSYAVKQEIDLFLIGAQGCGAADFTLRQGIEAILQKEIPEILQVLDVTDHAAGMNPSYRPAK